MTKDTEQQHEERILLEQQLSYDDLTKTEKRQLYNRQVELAEQDIGSDCEFKMLECWCIAVKEFLNNRGTK